MMFGFPMTFLNFNRTENEIVSSVSGIPIFDAVLGQYASSISGFDSENFAAGNDTFSCVVFYMAATMVTQLTMLNMIIAIMGDTFERISEKKETYATISRLELLGEYAFILKDVS